jgi:hypothetical protein
MISTADKGRGPKEDIGKAFVKIIRMREAP